MRQAHLAGGDREASVSDDLAVVQQRMIDVCMRLDSGLADIQGLLESDVSDKVLAHLASQQAALVQVASFLPVLTALLRMAWEGKPIPTTGTPAADPPR